MKHVKISKMPAVFEELLVVLKGERLDLIRRIFMAVCKDNNAEEMSQRFQRCPICNEVFWAKRIEASVCSKKRCSNDFHQRKLRIKTYEDRFQIETAKLQTLRDQNADELSIRRQEWVIDKTLIKISQSKALNTAV